MYSKIKARVGAKGGPLRWLLAVFVVFALLAHAIVDSAPVSSPEAVRETQKIFNKAEVFIAE